jgi:hypothetical protein
MMRKTALLGALVVGFSAAATAQVIIQQPQPLNAPPQPYYQTQPVYQPLVAAPAVMVQEPAQPLYVTRVYVPQGIIHTTVAQPAPFNPAPADTYIETTADRQSVKSVSGFDVVFEDSAGARTSHGLLISNRDEGSADVRNAAGRMWPLTVGKSEMVNLSSSTPTTITFKVVRTEVIAVPAGSFYTYVVERRERLTTEGTERIATSWYAPSVGAVVKFTDQTQRPVVKLQPSFELVTIRLPAAPAGATFVPAARRADTAESRQQFCQERGTILRLADGRVLYFDCAAYVTADRMGYDHWLLVR